MNGHGHDTAFFGTSDTDMNRVMTSDTGLDMDTDTRFLWTSDTESDKVMTSDTGMSANLGHGL